MVLGDKVPEKDEVIQPLLNLPISEDIRATGAMQHRHCGFFEMQWYKCLEAYGARLGRKYCDIEHRDFAECVNHDKSIKRADAIRKQREKLYREGKLEKKWEDDFPQMNIEGNLLDSEDSQSSFSAFSLATSIMDSEYRNDATSTRIMMNNEDNNVNPTSSRSKKKQLPITENMVHLLENRELGRRRRKVSDLKSNYTSDRNFYPSIPLSRFVLIDPNSFNGIPMGWTPDGKYLIVFRYGMRTVLLYRYLGVDCAMGEECDAIAKKAFCLEREVIVVPRAESQVALKQDMVLITADNRNLVVATFTPVQEVNISLQQIYAHNQSLGIVNQSLESYTFYSIDIETGVICGRAHFPMDKISLTNGVALQKKTLLVLSTMHQTLHIFTICPRTGQIHKEKEIGRLINEDDQLFIGNESPSDIIESKWLSGFKQRLNTFLFHRAKNSGPVAMSRFLANWEYRHILRIHRIQMIDDSRVLMRLVPKTVLSHTDYSKMTMFFVLMDWKTSQIWDVFEDYDRRFFTMFMECIDNLVHPSLTYNNPAPLTVHHNYYAKSAYIEQIEKGASPEVLHRYIKILPYCVSQVSVATPYLDPYLFFFDENFFKMVLNGRTQLVRHDTGGNLINNYEFKIRSRRTGNYLFSFKYPPVIGAHQVTILYHPTDPICFTIDRTDQNTPLALHLPQSSQKTFTVEGASQNYDDFNPFPQPLFGGVEPMNRL
ncbi:hypothetical protein WR25_17969 [Diploscapter pachys]|uniref:Uncharacterized protein n=1 Tax=Diploscapter pachys TaxID=2018661 RepID=A0A2A2LCR8_9BILA|nr:hypothetical protein WR25_17969 [Diploscapter pachys]